MDTTTLFIGTVFAGTLAMVGYMLTKTFKDQREVRFPAAGPASPPATPPEPPPLRIAVAAYSAKVRDVGTTATKAGDLLTNSVYWWSGSTDGWDALVRATDLSATTAIPESDGVMVVVVYEVRGTTEGAPSSRPEGAFLLRTAARSGDLRVIGTFVSSGPAQLSAAGFQRY